MSDYIAVSPPPDWYPDPDDASKQRYWDGQAWSIHRRSAIVANAQPPFSAPVVEAGAGYGGAATVKPGMIHSIILLVASFILAGMTLGVGLIGSIFAALASWASYQSGQAANRGEIVAAVGRSQDAKRWRKITYVILIVIGALAVVAYVLIFFFIVMVETTYAY